MKWGGINRKILFYCCLNKRDVVSMIFEIAGLCAASANAEWWAVFGVVLVVAVIVNGKTGIRNFHLIFTIVLVVARQTSESQKVKTKDKCKNFFHDTNVIRNDFYL